MMEVLIASTNVGKLREYRRLLADLPCVVLGPADLGLALDVEETGSTFAENALLKARAFADAAGLPAVADDSGLEVDALDGFPGVRSSRWAAGSDADRVRALLERLEDVSRDARTARFRTVAALAYPDGRVDTADGKVEGRIALAPAGDGGFGYDPVFLVEDGGYSGDRTMAELPPDEKDRLSHRGRAVRKLWPALTALTGGRRAD
jgi:XTP/dITP diphosphohydrolase